MRHFTLSDSNYISFFMSSNYIKSKTETIYMFLNDTLNRTLILLGDIFQKDLDIDTSGQERLEQVFKDIPRQKWATFEIRNDLPKDIFAR
jgi:hypothetical protein